MNNRSFTQWVQAARQSREDFIVALVQQIISGASEDSVSDLHFQPDKSGLEIWYRRDGVLQELGHIDAEYASQTTARLKVLANLLTYRTTTPQEGRVQAGRVPGVTKEMRVGTMPTLFGERVVIRFFAEEDKYRFPDQLGLSPLLQQELMANLYRNGGAIIICGPAGSGKTTTACSLLRQLAMKSEGLRSIITLEDPIEHPIARTAQVEVSGLTDMTLPDMIKYTMRQDPEVLFVGEIRDQPTALAAFQAALTGHVLVTTFHAGSACEAIARLSEMGIEPFVLRSSINAVVCQRLLRRLCSCAKHSLDRLVLTLQQRDYVLNDYYLPVGCEQCGYTGYHDRVIIAESIPWRNAGICQSVLERIDSGRLQKKAEEAGMTTLAENALALITSGVTSPLEVQRVLGMT